MTHTGLPSPHSLAGSGVLCKSVFLEVLCRTVHVLHMTRFTVAQRGALYRHTHPLHPHPPLCCAVFVFPRFVNRRACRAVHFTGCANILRSIGELPHSTGEPASPSISGLTRYR